MSGISATCTTDSSLFSLTCTGVSFKIDVDESCLASGANKYSLSADFDTSIYVSRTGLRKNNTDIWEREYHDKIVEKILTGNSDSADDSDIDDTDIDNECKLSGNSPTASEKKIEFNIDKW